jgi:hypothetical protein
MLRKIKMSDKKTQYIIRVRYFADLLKYTQIDTYFLVLLSAILGFIIGKVEMYIPIFIGMSISGLFFIMWRCKVRTQLSEYILCLTLIELIDRGEIHPVGKYLFEKSGSIFFTFTIIIYCFYLLSYDYDNLPTAWVTLYALWFFFDSAFPEHNRGKKGVLRVND